MVDAGIGRLLIASLHQGIADVSPTRLDFYENWLSPTGIRDGRIGLAPLGAVLSFVQREDPPADTSIASRAGVCAADWAYEGVSGFRRSWIKRLPLRWRTRAALGLGRSLVVETISRSKVSSRLRNGQAAVEIRSPLFDYLREPAAQPMRRYYAAAYTRCLELCDLQGTAEIDDGQPGCHLKVVVEGVRAPQVSLLGHS